MASDKVIDGAVNPAFCQRVAYMAIRVAQEIATESPDTENHDARLAYAQQVFRGDEKVLLLALHVVAQESAIATALEEGSDVADLDIENALKGIWDARALAHGAINHNLQMAKQIMLDAQKVADQASQAASSAMQAVTAAKVPQN